MSCTETRWCRSGALLLQTFRSDDVVGRWGGKEFVVGLYGATGLPSKARLMELLEIMRQQEFTSVSGEKFQVTFSGGISQYPENGRDLQALYQTADVALYKAKAKGSKTTVGAIAINFKDKNDRGNLCCKAQADDIFCVK